MSNEDEIYEAIAELQAILNNRIDQPLTKKMAMEIIKEVLEWSKKWDIL